MNDSHSRTHYRTVYATNKRRVEPATVVAVALVLLAMLVFFILLLAM